jgi:chemosensory pili system protein ChpE/L-lysine exporter family protein LysE/ArgO
MLKLLAIAFGLGLVLNAAPGPVFAETVCRGARGGFRLAIGVQVGSIVGDAVWAALGLLSIALLLELEPLRVPIGIAGAAYLLWLAWDAWRSARHEFSMGGADVAGSRQEALRAGLLLSLTNPQHLAYWAAVGSALGSLGLSHPTTAHYSIFFTGFLLSSIVWAFLISALVDRLFRRVGARWARLTYRACAIALLALALSMIRELWLTRPLTRAGEGAPASRPAY